MTKRISSLNLLQNTENEGNNGYEGSEAAQSVYQGPQTTRFAMKSSYFERRATK